MEKSSDEVSTEWRAGNKTQITLFEMARTNVRIVSNAGHSAVLWAGNAIVFATASVLGSGGGPDALHWMAKGPESGFSLAASAGFGISIGLVLARLMKANDHAKFMSERLAGIVASPEEIAKHWSHATEGPEVSDTTKVALRLLAKNQAARAKELGSAGAGPSPKP